jgi:hypothetical protein
MILSHLRFRRRVALLAAGVLEGPERERTRAHVEACPRCRRAHAELAAVVAAMGADPVRSAEPELPVSVLVDRVERDLDRVPRHRRVAPVGWRLALPAAVAATVALAFLGSELLSRFPGAPPAPAASATPSPGPTVSDEVLNRLERNMTREHAARYLSEAQDVLLAVAATDADCLREEDRVDVGEAPDRSRDLLARRALLVEDDRRRWRAHRRSSTTWRWRFGRSRGCPRACVAVTWSDCARSSSDGTSACGFT